jgi:hypothetical protein
VRKRRKGQAGKTESRKQGEPRTEGRAESKKQGEPNGAEIRERGEPTSEI